MPAHDDVRHGRGIAADTVTSWFRRHSAGWAVACLVLTLAGTAATVALIGLAGDAPAEVRTGLITTICTVVPYGLAGWVLISRRPDLPFGWLLGGAAAGLTLQLATLGPAAIALRHGHGGPLVALGMTTASLGFLPIGVQGIVNVRFPSGRPSTRAGRWLDRLLVWGLAVVVVSGFLDGAVIPELVPEGAPQVENPLAGTAVARVAGATTVVAPLLVLLGLIAGIGVVVRCWRATGIERQQLKWRAAGVVVALPLFPLAVTDRLPGVVDNVDAALFVATLAVPVLRYRLWSIDTIIHRSSVYVVVTVALVGTYAAITAVAAGLASQRVGASLAAAGVALVFLPARGLSQRAVDRLFYGSRSDPYRALSDVGLRLEAAAAPGGMLPAVVAGVAASLRLPYVALEGSAGEVLAAAGEPGAAPERWPLTYQGAAVGSLAASPRRGEHAFDERDGAILADIARQAGPAVRAEELTADLLRARQRLVTAREEDRRRLRRDLHDGLGPMLTGLGLNLDAARARLADHDGGPPGAADLKRADEFLARAKEASAQAITDLRGMVYELRPAALDELGLADAVRLHAGRVVAGAELEVDVLAGDLPALPAAVEVAAFRTAVEAVTNAVRHGSAGHCTVRLDAGSELVLEVVDDGGAGGEWRPGVGLTAMLERAEELGGTLAAGPGPGGGRVVARYPLPATGEVVTE